jgi:hypothetical protein
MMEAKMVLKRKPSTPQEYIQVGMAFFLLGIFASMVVDGRMMGAFIADMIGNRSILGSAQDFAAGFTIPIFCTSIYFNVRGLIKYRSERNT